MVSAIGAAQFTNYAPAAKPATNLEAQLDRYKQQLAFWVSCPSCNTIEGKTRIAEISARIGEIEAQMKVAEDAGHSDGSNTLPGTKGSNDVSSLIPASTNSVSSNLSSGTIGTRLDIFV